MSEETTEETTEQSTEQTTETEAFFSDTFIESITDEDVKGNKMWGNLAGKTADEVGKYMTELKSFSGKKGDIPKSLEDGGTEEQWNEFYQKLGRPENTDGYDFTVNDEFKALVGEAQAPFYEQAVDWFKDEAFRAGMSPKAADAMVDNYLNMIAEQTEGVKQVGTERKAATDLALKNAWGDSQEGIQLGIKEMLAEKGGMTAEEVDDLESKGLFSDPKLAIALGKLSNTFQDDPEIGGLHNRTVSGLHDQLDDANEDAKSEYRETGRISERTSKKIQKIREQLGSDL